MHEDRSDSYLPVAVRAYAVGEEWDSPTDAQVRRSSLQPEQILVFDTETTADPSMRLNFGAWRYLRVDRDQADPAFRCVQEGLFYADDLPARDARAYEVLREYVSWNTPSTDRDVLDASRTLHLWSQKEFLDKVFWPAAYQVRGLVCCFNFPFDLSRLAWHVGEARNRRGSTGDPMAGAFSFALWRHLNPDGRWKESARYRPRIAVKAIDSKRALKAFRSPLEVDSSLDEEGEEGWVFRGHFLDLRTLAFVMTDESHSLESACRAFQVPYEKRDVRHGTVTPEYVQYCREDVEATTDLCGAAIREFSRHPVDLPVTQAYSPATLGKAYLKKMKVTPLASRHRVSPETLGHAMSAYFGGRSEVRIRNHAVPVVYMDFASMYPTVCSLMGAWGLMTALTVDAKDSTVAIRKFIDGISVDSALDPVSWAQLMAIARIRPNDDVVPVRSTYGGTGAWKIGVNPLRSEQSLWFSVADLVASKLLTGRSPQIEEAVTFTPRGRLPELGSVNLLGDLVIDPTSRDFFRTLVEERRRTQASELGETERNWRMKGLKVLANSTSYGIYAQLTRYEDKGKLKPRPVYGLSTLHAKLRFPEKPGEYCFPPLAASITGGARLMLAILETLVTKAGGAYAMCDTDSMAVVATEEGGSLEHSGPTQVTALSWAQVEQIRSRFESLNPYDAAVLPGSILELESENFDAYGVQRQVWCYAISAKRYALFGRTDDSPTSLYRWSEHGLGHLLNPIDPGSPDRDWIRMIWEAIEADCLDELVDLEWMQRPAVSRVSITSPRLLQLFQGTGGDDYQSGVKPFNFLLSAFVSPFEKPQEEQVALVTAFEGDPTKWVSSIWINRYSGRRYQITTEPSLGVVREGHVTVKSYRDVVLQYARHPEEKSLDESGRAGSSASGLLHRRPVRAAFPIHIGKESNAIEEVAAGLVAQRDEAFAEYEDLEALTFTNLVAPVLSAIGVREVARAAQVSPASVSYAIRGEKSPRPQRRSLLTSVAKRIARQRLEEVGRKPSRDTLTLLSEFLDLVTAPNAGG